MRPHLFLLFLLFLFNSCEKRECECGDDITFTWKNNESLKDADILLPNAVLNIGRPLAFGVSGINNQIEWEVKSAKIYNKNKIFLDSEDPIGFVKNNNILEFPHLLFLSSTGGLINGPVTLEIELFFPESGALLYIDGTIYFYGCEDLNDEFNLEDCRWPGPNISYVTNGPC